MSFILLGILNSQTSGGFTATDDYELISTFEGSSTTGTLTVTFSSIPQTYKHLQIRHSIRGGQSSDAANMRIRFNGVDSGGFYDDHAVYATGSTVTWDYTTNNNQIRVGYTLGSSSGNTNAHGGGIIDILDYASTSKNKVVRSFGGARGGSSGLIALQSGVYRSTSAITSIGFSNTVSGEFLMAPYQGTCRISLYGIKG